jgi:hypothetical protein
LGSHATWRKSANFSFAPDPIGPFHVCCSTSCRRTCCVIKSSSLDSVESKSQRYSVSLRARSLVWRVFACPNGAFEGLEWAACADEPCSY